MREHAHRERHAQLDQAAADLADADDAQRLAEQLAAPQRTVRSRTTSRRIKRSASAIFLASESMNPSACSATASPGPELLHTITPARCRRRRR